MRMSVPAVAARGISNRELKAYDVSRLVSKPWLKPASQIEN